MCGGSIYRKKCNAVRSCAKDEDCGIPGMKVVNYREERGGDSKAHSSMRIINGSGGVYMGMRQFRIV